MATDCEQPGAGWELVTNCETAGVLSGATDLPVRSHPWLPAGWVVALNRDALADLRPVEAGR